MTAERPPPALATLLKRLADYGAVVCDSPSTDELAIGCRCAINMHNLHLVQCAGAVIDNKWQPAVTFERYYFAVFQRDLNGKPARSQVGLRAPKGRLA